jgi:hypothetical protein
LASRFGSTPLSIGPGTGFIDCELALAAVTGSATGSEPEFNSRLPTKYNPEIVITITTNGIVNL